MVLFTKSMEKHRLLKMAFLLFILCRQSVAEGQIVINEYSAANWQQFVDNHADYEDWIELYNTSTAPVSLANWQITDNPSGSERWKFAAGVSIPANGYLLLWCSGRDTIQSTHLHTNFKLTQTKNTPEKLTLYNAAGNIADQVEVKKTSTHQSRARVADGATDWKICTEPSPKLSNNQSKKYDRFVDRPVMSKEGGFYADSVVISIETDEVGGIIRYTTDGTAPTELSPEYIGPIRIYTTTVLKAVVYSPDTLTLPSFIRFNTYFINVNHTLEVISLSCDELLDLANGDNTLRPIGALEYFGKDKVLIDRTYGEMNSHGQDSWANDQRSLDWISRDEFGYSKAIEHQVFKGSTRDEFQRMIFRASGDDNYPAANRETNEGCAHMRDDYVQTLAHLGKLQLDVRKSERCIIYLNGQYWGVYSFREKLDDHDYTDYYYDQGKYDIQMVLTWGNTWGEYGGTTAVNQWKSLRNYVLNNNMNDSIRFAYVESQLDFLSLIDYVFVNTNSVCSDWLNYNTGVWRGKNPDGEHKKWGYILWDNDATFGFYINYTGIPDTSPFAGPCDVDQIDNFGDPERHIDMLNKLRTNPKFNQLYLSRYADLNNTTYTCENMLHVLDSMSAVIQPEMEEHANRWFGTYAGWQQNLAQLRYFIEQRCAYAQEALADCYQLEGPFEVHFKAEPAGKGSITLNTLPAESLPFSGNYFGNMQNKLTATPTAGNGYVFSHWEAKNTSFMSDSLQTDVLATFAAPDTIIAHFKLFSGVFAPEELLGVAAYPTIFDQEVYLSIKTETNVSILVSMYQIMGQTVAQFDLGQTGGERTEVLRLPEYLSPGVYLLEVKAGQAVKTIKLIKS